MTQNAHANEQPSWIFTKARVRSSLAFACTQPIAPTSPATTSGTSSLGLTITETLGAACSNADPRFAAQPVT